MRKSVKDSYKFENANFEIEVRKKGNWNYKNKDLKQICTKPIGIAKVDELELSWKHEEIFELIKLFHLVDVESIKMILDENEDTGEIKGIDKLFLDKLKDFIRELEDETKN